MDVKGVLKAVPMIFARETLERDTPPAAEREISFPEWLLRPETLPRPAVSVPPTRVSTWKWLFAPEPLPAPDKRAGDEKRSSLIRILLSREDLPLDPVTAPESVGGSGPKKRLSGKGGKKRSPRKK